MVQVGNWIFKLLLLTFSMASAYADVTTQNALLLGGNKKHKEAPDSSLGGASPPNLVCHKMLRHVFENATPRDEQQAGVFEEYKPQPDTVEPLEEEAYLWNCLQACCEKPRNASSACNVVLVFKGKCYHIRCRSNEACLPKLRVRMPNEKVQMVLVNPLGEATWPQLLKAEAAKQNAEILPYDEAALNFWKQPRRLGYLSRNQETPVYEDEDFPLADKRMNQMIFQPDENDVLANEELGYYDANAKFTACDVETPCPPPQQCVPLQPNAVRGVCTCPEGFVWNKQRKCVMAAVPYSSYLTSNEAGQQEAAASENSPEVATPPLKTEENKDIVVSVMSKEVRLPEQEVTLAAFTVPDEQTSDTKYKYLWTLISQPKGPMNGTISDQSKSKVKLSNLSEGLYTFKVTVTGDNGTFGEATANVTVLPENRINQPPQVIISPREQIIRQPTTNAILDGSTSTDDDKITNWHWEVISGPIGYQPVLPEVNTLQLDLTSPGNYTFKLTVTDSNNVTNSTTATIAVLKETDYAPVANAGDAVILYLPNNNVTLNGTASSDDHEIVAWEWTKDASDEAKAVDMQNTRTPYVQLSNLEEGMYTFVLKVTDGSGQSSTAKVHVFVKPPTNSPPVADAGSNSTTSLPINWVLLNGSESKDDIGIKSYSWRQLSGPNNAVILKSNSSIANATSLTLGLYEFELSVSDENNNTATDTTWVKIVQERNAAPIANGGGDHTITLPATAIYFNGSKSWDDLAVVKYVWTRDEHSLAAGVIVADTDKEPVMILTNLVQGRYVFTLTVSDDQGLTSSDTVSVNVRPDPKILNLVQMTLPMGISVLAQSELDSVVQKLQLLLGDENKIQVRELKYDLHTDASVLVFYVNDSQGKALDGLQVERQLRTQLQKDASILGAFAVDIRTTVCQNDCSGHGSCNPISRACICEAFWMPSAGYFFNNQEANCDWSILYVFVGVIVCCLLLSGVFWGIACACRQSKKPRLRQKVQKYSLIGNKDEEAANYSRNTSLTESETDSDVLFETRTKSNGLGKHKSHNSHNHGHGSSGGSGSSGRDSHKYGAQKLGRKIKA
ncbi:LOW QUALITY PROTEIN: dyslexia-associated protein KIAA0319-like protein [Drosophila ficusphila]|uniref:LOW QUALITY PROTEIN: dyslexia-associated protein KIAA0319-like protein n=1 Tax=Drosophila ficusphila TaxID=30025 RepID=UPI0007E7EA39|nr:LOW QUALITY PROTEIN: dyslexia-associated protein KIAA0319-like protein [Drosophila ficusphila]